MNDSLLRQFCESPHHKLIVAIVTIVFALIVMIPLVDDYFDKKESRNTLTNEIEEGQQTLKLLPELEERVAGLVAELALVEAREVSDSAVSGYRTKIISLVRSSGCQLRRIAVGRPTIRPWYENDDPLQRPGKDAKEKTGFSLEKRSAVVSIDGPMEGVHEFLQGLHKDDSFAVPQRLQLGPAGGKETQVSLELEILLFALARSNA